VKSRKKIRIYRRHWTHVQYRDHPPGEDFQALLGGFGLETYGPDADRR